MSKVMKGAVMLLIVGIVIYFVFYWLNQNSDTITITDATLIQRGLEWIARKA